MKTEVLIQMDGLSAKADEGMVLVLAASNLPWELDVAMLRRLEKRVLVPLPNEKAREAMLERFLAAPEDATSAHGGAPRDLGIASIAARTEGFSGADLRLLAKVRVCHVTFACVMTISPRARILSLLVGASVRRSVRCARCGG